MKRVFISYSRRNKTFAERLARDLDDAGLEVWIDFRQITGGELWQNEIFRGIERSEFVIFCMSPDSVVSEWCNKEIEAARDQKKLIIPIMVVNEKEHAVGDQETLSTEKLLKNSENLSWILTIHYISFVDGYEQAYTQLLESLPGSRPIGVFDEFDPAQIQNPFKGLEAFQQTDAHFFFGREKMIKRSLKRMQETRFLAFVGASGSGKSSLVRAGILPQLRNGALPTSETWRTAIFTPGAQPLEALVTRILPYLEQDDSRTMERVVRNLQDVDIVRQYLDNILEGAPDDSRLLIVIDQFEEVFTRASDQEAEAFIDVLVKLSTAPDMRLQVIVTMRADFFGGLSRYPELANLFEQENMIIVTEMTPANIRSAIVEPVKALNLKYEDDLADRILDDVRSQPGSLPLLQYALRQLFDKRRGAVLTHEAYEEIGGVRRALAQHAEEIFSNLSESNQEITRRLLLRLVEVGDSGEATRRKVPREELQFDDIDVSAVDEVIDTLTAAQSRLLIASREIRTDEDDDGSPTIWLEVSHEALIREWDRFKTWVSSRLEDLKYSTELRKLSQDWVTSGRDAAYLLVGKRLTRAEVWVEDADTSDLQREFINASLTARNDRENAEKERQQRELERERKNTARLRVLSVMLIIGFVGSLLGVVITVSQRNELETITGQLQVRTDELEQQSVLLARTADESQSLALAAEADRAFSDRETDLAVALALEATELERPPIRTQSTLNNIALAAGTRQLIRTDNLTIESLAYSPDATQIVTGLDNGEMIIWDVATGAEVLRWQAHNGRITTVAYHPDGTRIVSGSSGTSNNLRIWSAVDGSEIFTIPYHNRRVNSVKYTPDGQFFISASDDQSYVVWRDTTFENVFSASSGLNIKKLDVTRANAEGWLLAVADTDAIAIVNSSWEVIQQIVPRQFGLSSDITSMRIQGDGTLVIVGFVTGEIGLWNPRNGSLVQTFPSSDSQVNAVDFLPRDNKVVAGFDDGTMRIWDVTTALQTDTFNLDASIRDFALNRSEVRLAVSSVGEMRIWDIQGSAEVRRFVGHRGQVSSVAYHPDGQHILSGSFDARLFLWDTDDASIVRTFDGHDGAVVALSFNADGTRFVSGANDQTARIWNTETGEITLTFEGHGANITAVAWHPLSTLIASGSFDNRILLWDADTGDIVQELTDHEGSIGSLSFSPDGRLLLSGSFDDTLKIWNMETGEVVQTLVGHTGSVFAGAFNADATRVISGSVDKTVRVWDVATGLELRRFEGHDRVVNQVAFVNGSDTLISASSDGTLRLWDNGTGFEVYRYTVVNSFGRSVSMRSVAIKGDGSKAITGMQDTTIRQWEILPTIESLRDWTLDNRFVSELDCSDQIAFGLLSPLDVGQQVFITTDVNPLDLLADPTDVGVSGVGINGESVNLIRTDTLEDGTVFYQVCTAGGQLGWIPDERLAGLSA